MTLAACWLRLALSARAMPVFGLAPEGPVLEAVMIGKLGMPELLVILGIALLIFGPSKLSDLGKGLGEGIRNFKNAMGGSKEPENAPPAEKKS